MADDLLTLTVINYIDPNGIRSIVSVERLVVQVTGGVIHDPSSIDLTYTIGDDNWTGAEWLVNERSLERLRERVALGK